MLDTARLTIRPHLLDDYRDLCGLYRDQAVTRYIRGLSADGEEAWHRLLRHIGHWRALGYGMFAVRRRSDGRLIGKVGLADFHRGLGAGFDGQPEAAWLFEGEAHGKGFAAEAMPAVLEWFDATSGRDKDRLHHRSGQYRLVETCGQARLRGIRSGKVRRGEVDDARTSGLESSLNSRGQPASQGYLSGYYPRRVRADYHLAFTTRSCTRKGSRCIRWRFSSWSSACSSPSSPFIFSRVA
ncbi:GNAT family N-acetyltransferase [Sphingomonas sp. OTU376]|uniref:GNAT family N-acetyltransferase n=1 Tax=Sphingomonas sp. OTU376 TaxID=3043863 RepID=UPI00313F1A4A